MNFTKSFEAVTSDLLSFINVPCPSNLMYWYMPVQTHAISHCYPMAVWAHIFTYVPCPIPVSGHEDMPIHTCVYHHYRHPCSHVVHSSPVVQHVCSQTSCVSTTLYGGMCKPVYMYAMSHHSQCWLVHICLHTFQVIGPEMQVLASWFIHVTAWFHDDVCLPVHMSYAIALH